MASNPQTVKSVTLYRSELQGYIEQFNRLVSSMNNMKAIELDGANAPTQEDIDEINAKGSQTFGGGTYVPLTMQSWNDLIYASTGIYDSWTQGQNKSFLSARP